MHGTPAPAHIPVLRDEAVDALQPRAGGVYIDGTFGRGGYSRAILATRGTRVIGIDRDPDAIAAGRRMATEYGPRLTIIQGPFGVMDLLVAGQDAAQVDGIVLDLGVSSPQLDDRERGFSFMHDGPLDMRMSRSGPTAADIVNEMDEKELADTLYNYGEERLSRRVARAIVEHRARQRITRTHELATIVRQAVPRAADGIDPATRSFQALRILVNDELDELRRALKSAEALLKPHGRLAVVSFHSLEDRVVKDFLRRHGGITAAPSRHVPVSGKEGAAPSFHILTKKPQTPESDETDANPRARSARLRIAERTEAPVMKDIAA